MLVASFLGTNSINTNFYLEDWGTISTNTPLYQANPQNTFPTSISLRNDGGCRILDNATVECWGNNYYGDAGNGSVGSYIYVLSPTLIVGNHNIKVSNVDEDFDGIISQFDNCPAGITGWSSNLCLLYTSPSPRD